MISKKIVIVTVFVLVLMATVLSSNVLASSTSNRIMGEDRYKTAVAISQTGWPDGAATAILATGENYPDALSAAPLAHKYNAPILLTQSNALNDDTASELKRLKVKKVYLIGGLGVLSANIETQLAKLSISSARIAGQDRYDTSIQIAKALGTSKGAFITTGLDFPDAISAAPIAAAQGMPIILVPPDSLPASTSNYLSSKKFSNLYVLNGSNELSDNLVNQLSNAEVITGNDPYERNVNLIKRFSDNLNFNSVYVATGSDYPDALAASALAQKNQAPVILVPSNTVPSLEAAFLRSKLVNSINIVGGDAAISSQTESALKSMPAGIVALSNITDTVADKKKYQLPKTVTATLSDGSKVEVPVTWGLSSVKTGQSAADNNISTNNPNSTNTNYIYTGTVAGYDGTATLTLSVDASLGTVKFDNLNAEAVLGFSYDFPSEVTGVLSNNTLQQFPVTWDVSSNNATLSKVGSYTFRGSVEGTTNKVTLNLKVVENVPVNITGSLAQQVRYQLTGLYYGNTLYLSDILKITKLNVYGKYITDLNGLDNFYNLTEIDLGYNSLTSGSLAPLQKLKNLKVLKLNHNNIENFAPLKSLTNLNTLYVSNNVSKDYSPLKSIYNKLIYRDFTIN